MSPCLANSKYSLSVPSLLWSSSSSLFFSVCVFFPNWISQNNSRDFLNFVLVHKAEGSANSVFFFLAPGAPEGSLNSVLPHARQPGLGQRASLYALTGPSLPLPESISLHSDNTGISTASKQERNAFMPQYQQALLSYAKCHSGSFPENTSSQVPRGRLHPVDKMRGEKIALDETDDAVAWRLANSKHGCHFLLTYYVPGTVLSTLHRFSHLILVTNCMRASPLLFCLYSCGKSGSQGLNSLPEVKHSQEIADVSFTCRQPD